MSWVTHLDAITLKAKRFGGAITGHLKGFTDQIRCGQVTGMRGKEGGVQRVHAAKGVEHVVHVVVTAGNINAGLHQSVERWDSAQDRRAALMPLQDQVGQRVGDDGNLSSDKLGQYPPEGRLVPVGHCATVACADLALIIFRDSFLCQ